MFKLWNIVDSSVELDIMIKVT